MSNAQRLSWNEIRANAARFADEWKNARYERGETQSFYNGFFDIFAASNALTIVLKSGGQPERTGMLFLVTCVYDEGVYASDFRVVEADMRLLSRR